MPHIKHQTNEDSSQTKETLKVSLITVAYNAAQHIRSCIESILQQDYPHIEYIIIDGNSIDGTQVIVESYGNRIARFISEEDNGLYDAMNKGISLASGDIVGILNADDFYPNPHVISKVVEQFKHAQTDTVFADLVFVTEEDLNKVVRYFPGKGFHLGWLSKGMIPPHPTFFVKREAYIKHGSFDTSFKIAADFDLILRLLHKHGLSYSYIPEVLVKMRTGGLSTQGTASTLTINQEILRSCRKHGLRTNLLKIYSKYFTKIFQLIIKPKKS